LDLVFHHIIPFYRLRDVWNALVHHSHATQLAQATVALRHYLLLCNPSLPLIEQRLNCIRTGALDVAQCNELATLAVWPPWNIVEGPHTRLRTDDPGDYLIDRYTHGLTVQEQTRMRAIETLDAQFETFVATIGNRRETALRAIAEALRAARQSLACATPIYIRARMWDEDHGRWSKRRTGERIIQR